MAGKTNAIFHAFAFLEVQNVLEALIAVSDIEEREAEAQGKVDAGRANLANLLHDTGAQRRASDDAGSSKM